jgi:hypothetical protein
MRNSGLCSPQFGDELLAEGYSRSMEAYSNVVGSGPQSAGYDLDRDLVEVHTEHLA